MNVPAGVKFHYKAMNYRETSIEQTPSGFRVTVYCTDPYSGKLEGIVLHIGHVDMAVLEENIRNREMTRDAK